MKHTIQTTTPEPPEQRVTLDLSVEEFAGLVALHNSHGGGDVFGLRGAIEAGLYSATESLDEAWRAKIETPSGNSLDGYAYDRVEEEFAS